MSKLIFIILSTITIFTWGLWGFFEKKAVGIIVIIIGMIILN